MRTMVGLALSVIVYSGAATAGVLDKPAFTATPEELLAEARRVAPGDAPVVYLRDDVTVAYDAQGRAEQRHHIVIAIHGQAGVDDWGTLTLGWQPFYQDRPVVRARVIAPGGAVAELDQTLVSDAPSVAESPVVFSDRRDLSAPLPRLAIGAVIEEEIVYRDREPLLPAGVVEYFGFRRSVPVQRRVVTVSAPATRKLHVVTRNFPRGVGPKRTTAGGRATWTWTLGPIAGDDSFVEGLPSDVSRLPYVGVATAASWAAVAADYHRVVQARLAAPVTLPAGLAPGTDRAALDRIVAWLHAHVRYTGIELSDSAIVPWAPADTLARGFGDCKDKATLLVGLLRAAGIPADLALLSTGPGFDTLPELPGMGSFDHAIVRARVGGRDVWIDATADTLPAGQLPSMDQGRRALIVAADTRGLVTIPAAAAADNLIREVRTYRLSETLYADVTEVTHQHGVHADDLRIWHRDQPPADVRTSLTGYVAREYDGKLASYRGSDPHDLATPFVFTVEVDDVRHATATRDGIDVYLDPSNVFDRVPDLLGKADAELDADVQRRTHDYQWYVPMVYEIEHRLELPPGHAAPAMAAEERRALGTMTFTAARRLEGRVAVITYRLDTGKPRLTAAEVRATRAATRAFLEGDQEHVVIPEAGAALRQQGKLVEAIAEHQRVIALHPKEAVHHSQLALTYAHAGMIAAARRAARKATEVEPTSGDGFQILAYVLRFDEGGRDGGGDRKAVLAAYREALRRAPDHLGAIEDLARQLAVDAHGRLTSDASAQREAASLWRRARELVDNDSYDDELVSSLAMAGQHAELAALAPDLTDAQIRATAQVSAAALAGGIAAARPVLDGLPRAIGDAAATKAAGHMLLAGRYDVMRELHAVVSGGRSSSAGDRHLQKLGRRALDPADPATPLVHLFDDVAGVPSAAPWTTDVAAEVEKMRAEAAPHIDRSLATLPRALAQDLLAAGMEIAATGDAATGWTVRVQSGGHALIAYVVKRGKRAELIGGPEMTRGIGRVILDGAAGDRAAATRWLARLASDYAGNPAPLPSAIVKLHRAEAARAGAAPLPTSVLELAGGLLLGAARAPEAVAPLRRCIAERDELRAVCRDVLGALLAEAGRWAEAAEVLGPAAAAAPDDLDLAERHALALAYTGKRAEAIALLDPWLARRSDVDPLRARMRVELPGGAWAATRPWVDRLADHAGATVQDLNNAAWIHLFHDATPDAARALALRAEARHGTGELPPNVANTLAAVMAEAGEPHRAWQYLQRSMPAGRAQPLGDADWYVLGRIAEAYGLRDDAIAMYRRVAAPRRPARELPMAYDFAQRNLARLGVK